MDITFKQCNSANYTKGRTSSVEFLVIHYTANDGDTAKDNAEYFANNQIHASANYFVDENEVYQSVADTDTAWHCGTNATYKHTSCRNKNSLGIEMCSLKRDGKHYFKEEVIKNTVELVKSIMKKYNISIEHVLRHYDVTGKDCPAPFVEDPEAWTNFKSRLVQEEVKLADMDNTPSTWAKEAVGKAVEKGILKGDEKGNLKLHDYVTREQLMVILNKVGLLD